MTDREGRPDEPVTHGRKVGELWVDRDSIPNRAWVHHEGHWQRLIEVPLPITAEAAALVTERPDPDLREAALSVVREWNAGGRIGKQLSPMWTAMESLVLALATERPDPDRWNLPFGSYAPVIADTPIADAPPATERPDPDEHKHATVGEALWCHKLMVRAATERPDPTHSLRWIDAGRDEPPENGYWRCSCGVTFAPDGVESGIAHGLAIRAATERPSTEPLDVERVQAALDRAWLASHDAQGMARPADLGSHLYDALARLSPPAQGMATPDAD